jgi:predicted NBD/HSP70 family sugar kinase
MNILPPIKLNSAKQVVETVELSRTTRRLLRLLRALQPVSRIDLTRHLGVNRSTVTDICKPLINAGIIREEPFSEIGKSRLQGRPPIGLVYVDTSDYFIGVNLGVRRSQVGMSTLNGDIVEELDFITPPEPEKALAKVRLEIEKIIAKVTDRTLQVIGISVPGPTDALRRNLLYAPHLGWENVAIADALKFGDVPVVVENDASATTMFEARLKMRVTASDLLTNFILIRSGTGIGVGLVLNGEVYRGAGWGKGIAGEFGHTVIMAGGKQCVCGNRGCWERYAAAAAAVPLYTGERAQLGSSGQLNFMEIVNRAEAGEIRAKKTLELLGDYLGIGIANVIIGIGIPHVIVSGRLVYGWQFIKEPLVEAVKKSMVGKLVDWTIECGEPKGAVLGGAVEVAIEEFLARGFNV